ncbi:alpha/beta hydrolase [Mycolicibacterium sp. XJ1819]
MSLDPEVKALLDDLAAQGLPAFDEMTVTQARETAYAFIDLQGDAEDVDTVWTEKVAVAGSEVEVRIYRPASQDPLPLVVYFHGGGWVIGDLTVVDKPCRSLANAAGAVVAAVGYRLAPEHRFPTPAEDCYQATAWLVRHAAQLGADPAAVTVCGDSAGGNLAAVVALMARDRNGPAIARQVLLYPPMLPPRPERFPSYVENAQGYLLTTNSMQWFWNHYLSSPDDADNPYAAPLTAADLTGLPPAFVAVCEYDPLRDEGIAYAEQLEKAGVSVTLRRVDGAVHAICWMAGVVALGRSVLEDVARQVFTAPKRDE